ncbi:hypothetical protein GE061_000921 [Apolygus lucorum]|uniref:Uncharacterized protein n=1 Tax=Apolygus lucorum TaxID=248454 RepID=A0A6A4K2Y1_APOLU|nr:hypothetical protein GE061_000921 [Apolygus lucorum]
MSYVDSESDSDSDGLIWDFGKPHIPEAMREKLNKMEKPKTKKRKSCSLWPSPHSVKEAVDKACKNRPDCVLKGQDEPLEAFRTHFKLFRDRLNQIALEAHTTIAKDQNPIKKIKISHLSNPPHKKVEPESDANVLNDSIDEESLALCSQLAEEKFVNARVNCINPLVDQRGKHSSSNGVGIHKVIERVPGRAPSIPLPTTTQSSKPSNPLDDDDDLFLNESLLTY